MNYELRILSGLHRGATLPMDADGALEIGASEQAGVVLVDPGMAPRHARISASEGGWLVEALEGELFSPEDSRARRLVELQAGGFARIGEVWISIVAEDAPWQTAPSLPQPDLEQLALENSAADEAAAAAAGEPAAPAAPVGAAPPAAAPARPAGKRPRGRSRLRRLLFLPFAVLIVLSGAGAYAISSRPTVPAYQKSVGEGVKALGQPVPALPPGGGGAAAAAAYAAGAAAADPLPPADVVSRDGAVPPPLNGTQLQTAFRKRLSDAQLLPRLDLKLEDKNWAMHGDLDVVETARFQRVLKGFLEENKVSFPVSAKIVSSADMLPFEIRQVISGNNASIVTEDGARLFVGDEYRGVKLVSLKGNNMVFAGKRKFEVTW
ncbi:MAG: FHA domain-containing protein [Pseudomonadota bacterium]